MLRVYDDMNFLEKSLFHNKVKYLHKFKTHDIEIFHLIRKFHYDICVLTLGQKIPANCMQ